MLTEEFLKNLFKQRNLSDAEAEVVFLALKDISIERIADQLNISANAVRKRLGEVYDKLGVSGRGPGKLAKLQQMLLSLYQAQSSRKLLIWWSGSDGKHLAKSLKDTIFSYPQLETKVCTVDPIVSKAWRAEIEQSLKNVDIVIGCLTSASSQNLWVNYAAGFLAGQIPSQLIHFGESLSGPLTHLPSINGAYQEELARLLQEITGSSAKEAKEWVKFKFPKLNEEIKQQPLQTTPFEEDKLGEAIESIKQTEDYLKANKYIFENVCFELIILNSFIETRNQLLAVNSDYYIPAVLYPQRLIYLQREYSARVTALALVDHQEQFWPEAVGREILDTVEPMSTRVFVFTRAEDFDRNFEMLLEHTSKYNVFVMSYKTLARDFQGFVKDFSLIEVYNSKVLAEYVEESSKPQLKNIRFSADFEEVTKHEVKIMEIIKSEVAIPMRKELETIIHRVQQIKISDFEGLQKLTQIQQEVRISLRKKVFW
jgi:DNA-binding CsgD family transcriptional regulator